MCVLYEGWKRKRWFYQLGTSYEGVLGYLTIFEIYIYMSEEMGKVFSTGKRGRGGSVSVKGYVVTRMSRMFY